MQNLKSQVKGKVKNFIRRKFKVNSKIKATTPDFRVVVNKSNMYMKAQVLDAEGNVVVSICDKAIKADNKVARAEAAGEQLAKLMKDKWIEKAAYDRNGYLYHGRVKAMSDGIRKWGIQL